MASREKASDPAPPIKSLRGLADAAQDCKACPLYQNATQAVFGDPFVGPAGGVLDKALEEAGIDRTDVYVTNAVKHFSWEPRGKRRIHKKPRVSEIKACRPWLDAELTRIKPRVIVCMGTTAVQALLGPATTIAKAAKLLTP